jgi:predicted  nucleic acid-binding Zn-ribbon protein
LDDLELYVVPQDTSIGKISYDQGLRVAGTINVAGFSAFAKVEIDPTQGIEAAGSLSPVHIGDIFSLTADGSNAGPSLDIQVKATAVPKIAITGQASLLGLTAAAHVTLSDSGFDFGCAGKVFGVFDAAVTAKGSSLQSADGFSVHAQMSQNFLSDLTSRAAGVLQQAAAQASAQIAAAQRDVSNAQAEVDRLNTLAAAARADLANKQADAQRQIANAQAQVTGAQNSLSAIDSQIASTRAGIQAERDAAAAKIQAAQAAVNAAQGPVNDLNSQISALQGQINQLNSDIAWWNNWYNNSAWYQKSYRWAQLSAEVGWRGTKVAALTVAMGTLQGSVATANGVLQAAVQTLHAAQAAAVTYPIDQDPRIVALQTGRGAAVLGLQAAQGVLSATQQATAAAITAAGQTVTTLAQQAGAANSVLQTTNSALGLLRQGVGEVAGVAGYIAAHGLGALLDVRSASFDGSISATHGGAVTLDAVVVFQATQQTVHVSYDFNDLVAGAKALAKSVLPSLSV